MRRNLHLRDEQGAGWADGVVLGILLAVVVTASTGVVTLLVRGGDTPSAVTSSTTARVAAEAAAANVRRAPLEPSERPLRVRIPAIGVDTPLVPLGIDADGALEVPRYEEAGWYAGGSRPGEAGPAVIAAHVDSLTGPAVFYRLRELEPGEEVQVEYRSVTVRFVVRYAELVDKSEFPTKRVYGSTQNPELRLVTCAGTFDRSTRSYVSNLIVWADLLP